MSRAWHTVPVEELPIEREPLDTPEKIAAAVSWWFGDWCQVKADHWKDMDSVSIWEAVFLSIGLDPRSPDWVLDKLQEPLELTGRLRQLYEKRVAQIIAAIRGRTLAAPRGINPTSVTHTSPIRLKHFVAWADKTAKWDLPRALNAFLPHDRAMQKQREFERASGRKSDLLRERNTWLCQEAIRVKTAKPEIDISGNWISSELYRQLERIRTQHGWPAILADRIQQILRARFKPGKKD